MVGFKVRILIFFVVVMVKMSLFVWLVLLDVGGKLMSLFVGFVVGRR